MGLRSLAEKAAVIRYFGDNALAIDRIEILYLNAYLLRLCANFLCGGQPRGVCCWHFSDLTGLADDAHC
jgi:hypothetical protein